MPNNYLGSNFDPYPRRSQFLTNKINTFLSSCDNLYQGFLDILVQIKAHCYKSMTNISGKWSFPFKILFILVILGLSAEIFAQSLGKILSQANKAMGGEKALKAITSWRVDRRIKRLSDGAVGKYAAYATGGSLYGEAFDLNGFEAVTGYNGKSGWKADYPQKH